ncbi:MAG: cytochrome c1, partial [Planctomycetota bacterium]|nr:cytochrome c1 [Planctomycetota bacterium]
FAQSPRKIKLIGKAFAGTSEKENGLSCVKCHTFGNYKATGIQAISLTSMAKRLNKDWFQLYMMKPSRFRPGTRMPESWPGGQSFFPDVLGGDANQQIGAIWEYLSDGEKAAKPKGLVQAKMQLLADGIPKLYRNFIEGGGSRAIGVGYPEELNLAFDANNNRLAMIWQGAFIDASRHWVGRGQGYQPPLGDNVLKLPEGVSFAKPMIAETEWPKQTAKELGLRFKGYRFNRERQPSFQYQLDDVKISDFPMPHVSDEESTFKRVFTLTSTKTKSVWYRAAVGAKITQNDDGSYAIGQDYRVRISGKGEPTIRTVAGNQELLIKISLAKGRAEFTQEYIW